MTGVEPASPAWEAGVLPMNYICISCIIAHSYHKVIKNLLQILERNHIIQSAIGKCQRWCTQNEYAIF